MRAKRLYRAIARYEDGPSVGRHFQTRRARDQESNHPRHDGHPDPCEYPECVQGKTMLGEFQVEDEDYMDIAGNYYDTPYGVPDNPYEQ